MIGRLKAKLATISQNAAASDPSKSNRLNTYGSNHADSPALLVPRSADSLTTSYRNNIPHKDALKSDQALDAPVDYVDYVRTPREITFNMGSGPNLTTIKRKNHSLPGDSLEHRAKLSRFEGFSKGFGAKAEENSAVSLKRILNADTSCSKQSNNSISTTRGTYSMHVGQASTASHPPETSDTTATTLLSPSSPSTLVSQTHSYPSQTEIACESSPQKQQALNTGNGLSCSSILLKAASIDNSNNHTSGFVAKAATDPIPTNTTKTCVLSTGSPGYDGPTSAATTTTTTAPSLPPTDQARNFHTITPQATPHLTMLTSSPSGQASIPTISSPPSYPPPPVPTRAAQTNSAEMTTPNPSATSQPPSHRTLQCHYTRKLEDYTLLNTLGTGTFGRVYLCRYSHDRHFYAMKVLRKSQVVKLKQVEHINNEKTILEDIRFPFIVNLLCTMQNERNLYMLMEYVPGGELFTHLRRAGRFPEDVARFYAGEIILAIEHLHQNNVIYRDMKPENLLLDARGNIKITDFGFAKKVDDRTWTLCGTPEYLAPEIIQSKGYGKAVDWWAIGILIFEMLAGYPPFYDDNPFGIYEKILAGNIHFPPFFNPAAKDLISRLLTADVSRRLGNLQNEANDIKHHPWFAPVRWDLLLQRKIRAPIIPHYAFPGDTSNFDRYPELPKESDPEPGVDPYRHLFSTF